MDNNDIINKAIKTFARLPGIGEKSAQRIMFYLIKKKEAVFFPLINQLDILYNNTLNCQRCNNIYSKQSEEAYLTSCLNPDWCDICNDPLRVQQQICVVEDVSALWALEKSKAHRGIYFILDGVLNATNGSKLEQERIPQLLTLITNNKATEVILATSLTVEGQTTSFYIKEEIARLNLDLKITTLAQGVPVGGEIDYLDELTLGTAIKLRKSL